MTLTADQQRVIKHRDGNLLVSASAGSGKTSTMLERVIGLIREGSSLKKMVISTFTNSAADDMRAKLFEKFNAEYERTHDDRYKAEIDYLPTADVTTLHKWCLKLIRKYFYVTGDDPAFDVIDEVECARFKSEAVAQAIVEAETNGEYAQVATLYVRKRSDRNIKNIVLDIMNFCDALPSPEEWMEKALSLYVNDESCKAYLNSALFTKKAYITNKCKELLAFIESTEEFNEKQKTCAFQCVNEILIAVNIGEKTQTTRASNINLIKDDIDDLRGRNKEYLNFLSEVKSADNSGAEVSARVFLSLAMRALEIYAEKKVEKGLLDFSDLERKAKIILSSSVGDEVRESIDYVFIDEYQDINPLQESIINLMGHDNLFFVGDVKQSIYAFRNCTPEIFVGKMERLQPNNAVELNQNFRSGKQILHFCNEVFSAIMTKEFGKVDYDDSAKLYPREDASEGSVEIINVPTVSRSKKNIFWENTYSVRDNPPSRHYDNAEAEANAVTQKIVEIVENNPEYTFGDVVVLTRSRSSVTECIARNLRQIGVPVSIENKSQITQGKVNQLLISFLRLIDNFRDDVSLLAVMRSPLGGFSDEELVALRKERKNAKFFYDCVRFSKEEKVKDFLDDIKKYVSLSRTMTVGELAGKITSDKKLFHTAFSCELGVSKADGLSTLLRYINDFDGTLSEFLENASDLGMIESAVQPDSVRIMTVHASKGLEFPVVIACDLSKPFRSDASGAVLEDGEFGLGVETRRASTGEKKPSTILLSARYRKKFIELEEEMRILYVALTRAKDKLVLFLDKNKKYPKEPTQAKSFADWLLPVAHYYGFSEVPQLEQNIAHKTVSEIIPSTLEKMRKFLEFDYSGKTYDVKKTVSEVLTTALDDSDGARTFYVGEYDGTTKNEAMARGTLIHTCLENFDYSLPFAEQNVCYDGLTESDVKLLSHAFDEIGKETQGAQTYRELPFIFKAKDVRGIDDGTIVQGVIDLLIIKGDTAEIIDYKTGAINAERHEKYCLQLSLYASAVENVLHIPVTKKRIYLVDAKRFAD